MQIQTAYDQWTPVSPILHARIWNGRVWRKDLNEAYYGGYQIKYVGVTRTLPALPMSWILSTRKAIFAALVF